MVSQAEPVDRTLAARRPPSVSSRTSITRRQRHNRSHYGGSSYQPQNEFPIFTNTGDVEILINSGGREERYLLHRLILAQCSGFFEIGTSQEWSRQQSGPGQSLAVVDERSVLTGEESGRPGRAEEAKRRWRYELDHGNGEDDIPMLVQKVRITCPILSLPLKTMFPSADGIPSRQNPSFTLFGGDHLPRPPPIRSKPPISQAGFFRSMANFSAIHLPSHSHQPEEIEIDTIRDYDNLFRIFYNYPPNLDPINIANAYVQCKSLLNLADMYDALEVIGPRVDHHLLRFQGRLWKQIAKYPPSYLKLGYLARSKVIFAEAMVHVVGQWPSGATHLRSQVPEQVMEVIEDKVEELEDLKSKIEGRLFRLTLTTPRGERVTPSNCYLAWTAVSLFRQWLAENTTPPPIPNHKDTPRRSGSHGRTQAPLPPAPPPVNVGRVYRLLGTGGSSYLGRDELKRFLKLRPEEYSRENLRRFEQRMEEIKDQAREIARPLMRNFLELDLGNEGGSLGYLTCTRVDERDFPWDE